MITLDAAAIAKGVQDRKLDPVAVVDAFCAQIAARNTELNALIVHDRVAARLAAAAVAGRVAKGEHLPLAGVPVIIKDNIWVKGERITQGSRLFADFVAPEDAIGVSRLRDAGAVIIGIGNCPEFACKGQTNSPLHGAARHPMDLDLTPGGSSGGNAAGLAADFAPIAVGTDAGGSGRRPAAHTGIVGFKPSFGAIPYAPAFIEPYWGVSVIAPMGRTVSDVALMFGVMAGREARDPDCIDVAPSRAINPAHLRIAYSPKLGLDVPVDEDVVVAIEAGVQLLSVAGWTIVRRDPVWPAGTSEMTLMQLQHAGLAALYGRAWQTDPEQFDPDIGVQIERGLAMSGVEVSAALEANLQVRRAMSAFFSHHDILLSPTTPCVAWSVSDLGPTIIDGVAVPPRGHAVFTPLLNHARTPAISVPCGRGRAGLPVGMQMIGAIGHDWTVLAAARAAETILSGLGGGARRRH